MKVSIRRIEKSRRCDSCETKMKAGQVLALVAGKWLCRTCGSVLGIQPAFDRFDSVTSMLGGRRAA